MWAWFRWRTSCASRFAGGVRTVGNGNLTQTDIDQAWELLFEAWMKNPWNEAEFFRRVDEIDAELAAKRKGIAMH